MHGKTSNIKYVYSNNKFQTSARTQNDKLELPDGSCSIADIQDHFEYIIRKHESWTNNPSFKKLYK